MAKRKFFTKKRVIAGVILLVAAALILPSILNPVSATPPLVSVKEADFADIRSVLSTTGTLVAEESNTYTAPMGGIKIDKVNVKAGDFVTAGTPLVTFDSTEVERQYKQALLNYDVSYYTYLDTLDGYEDVVDDLNEAKMDVKNLYRDIEDYDDEIARVQVQVNNTNTAISTLNSQLKDETLTEQQKDDIRAEIAALTETLKLQNQNLMELRSSLSSKEGRLESKKASRDTYQKQVITDNKQKLLDSNLKLAELALDVARQNYKEAVAGIVAEADGIVTELGAVENTLVTQGQVLAVLKSKDPVAVSVPLSRYDLERVEIGQTATVTFVGKEYAATVNRIGEAAQPVASGTPSVYAEILLDSPDESIKLGLEATVDIITAEKTGVLTIPVETVNTDKEGRFCYVAEEGIVVKRYITTGASSDMLIEVLSGLEKGALVLYNPPEYITPGMAVTTTFEDISTLGGGYISVGV